MSYYWTAGPTRSEPRYEEHHEECPQHPDSGEEHPYKCECREIDDKYRELAAEMEFERYRDERWMT